MNKFQLKNLKHKYNRTNEKDKMIGKRIRATTKTCQCEGGHIVEVQGIVMKIIEASNGTWIMLDTPNGTKTVKYTDIIGIMDE